MSQVMCFLWKCSLFQVTYKQCEGRVIESLRVPNTRLPAPDLSPSHFYGVSDCSLGRVKGPQ